MFENRLPSLIQQYKVCSPDSSTELIKQEIESLNKLDPTGNKAVYTPWLLNQFLKGRLRRELASNLLLKFENLKKLNRIKKGFDINKYNFNSLSDFISSFNEVVSKEEINIESLKLGEILYNDKEFLVLRIRKSDDIAKFLKMRRISSWCIKDAYTAKAYAPVYFICQNDKLIAAWSDEDEALSNRNNSDTWDEPFRDKLCYILKKANPKLKIKTYLQKAYESPENMLNYILDYKKKPFPEGENLISKNALTSFTYASNVLHGRFIKGEKSIADNVFCSVIYARVVLNQRFTRGEKNMIEQNKRGLCSYYINLYKARFNIKRLGGYNGRNDKRERT